MKKIQLFSGVMLLCLITPKFVLSQANRQLSNLLAPTKINQHLWPGTKCTYDLGTNTIKWRYGYFCRGIGISPNNVGPSYPLDILNRDYGRAVSAVNTNYVSTTNRTGVYSYSVSSSSPGYGYGVLAYGGRVGTYSINSAGAYTGTTYGVNATSSGTAGTRYGVFGGATGSGGTRFGVYGYACAGTSYSAYGVYGRAGCGKFKAAGYFSGAVFATSYNIISDRKFKTQITPLKNSLQQLMKLKPSGYQFNKANIDKMGLSEGNQLGLIADEVKQVFPELVQETVKPAEYNEDETLVTPEEKYESVNYLGLIPVIIASLQEQQKTIANLKTENEDLKAHLAKLEQSITLNNNSPEKTTITAVTLNSAWLKANTPNPFNKTTTINYYLPEQSGNASINIIDMSGRILKTIALTKKGSGQLILEAGQLEAGTYQYSLNIQGKLIDSRKMVLTR